MREINRRIAEKLGYTIYHYDKDMPAHCYYMLMDPEGNAVAFKTNSVSDENTSLRIGERKTEAAAWEDCPDWAGDPRYAVELLDNRYAEIIPEENGMTRVKLGGATGYVEATGASLSEAIANAFVELDLKSERRALKIKMLRGQQAAIEAQIASLEAGAEIE